MQRRLAFPIQPRNNLVVLSLDWGESIRVSTRSISSKISQFHLQRPDAGAQQRMSNDFELLASYTLSKTRDDASAFDEQPQNPFDLRQKRPFHGRTSGTDLCSTGYLIFIW